MKHYKATKKQLRKDRSIKYQIHLSGIPTSYKKSYLQRFRTKEKQALFSIMNGIEKEFPIIKQTLIYDFW